jgi:predicted TIM-barrel fold metal-dependent hydrolase
MAVRLTIGAGIVDAWMQHPGAEFLRDPMFDSLRRWKSSPWSEQAQPVEATLAAMDKAGVAVGLLCAWSGPSGPLIGIDEVAKLCAAHPGRFVGVASVDLYGPMDAVRELRRCARDLRFKALRVLPWLWGLPPDDRRYYPLYAECCELDITFCTQVGHAGHCGHRNPGAPSPILTMSPWSSRSYGSWAVTSVSPGLPR